MDVPDCAAIATRLRALADLVEVTAVDDSKMFPISVQAARAGRPEAWFKQIRAWEISDHRYLYQVSTDADHSKRIGEAFLDAKTAKVGDRAYCRFNTWSDGDRDGTVLYVGGTQELAKRLIGHLGFGYGRTYAMHLSHWIPELEGELLVTVWRYRSDIESATIQAIEDGLWAIRKPLLGRQGAR